MEDEAESDLDLVDRRDAEDNESSDGAVCIVAEVAELS
jgi:hypothetical protein